MLDAKYRDLREQPLPRDMLYQLVIYASSSESRGRAVLYPTLNPAARDACIEVRDPPGGGRRAEVIVRPVDLLRLDQLVPTAPRLQGSREAVGFAH